MAPGLITIAASLLLAARAVCDPPGPAATQPPAAPDSVGEAEAVIERAARTYEQARSYRDSAVIRHETHWTGIPDAQAHETHLEFRYAAPNLFVLRGERGGAYCDGARLWLHNADARIYWESAAPEVVPLDDLDRRLPSIHMAAHPVARALLGSGTAQRAWGIAEVINRRDDIRAGAPGHRVQAMGYGDIPDPTLIPLSLWFSESTGLLEEIVVDLTPAFRSAHPRDPDVRTGPAHVLRVTFSIQLQDVHVDDPMEPADFAFHPFPEDRRVEELPAPLDRAREAQASAVGQPAPAFDRPLLDGGSFSPAQVTGRVLVLYFWDTASPASIGSLSRAAALADRFGAEAVTVLGVNQDPRGAHDRVRRIVERERAARRQVLDAEGTLATAFGLVGIPSTIVIDQKGSIRAIQDGALAEHEESVVSRVRALLAQRTDLP